MKLVTHLVVFALGIGAGIYWGVQHPTAAADLAGREQLKIQAAVSAAKIDLLQRFNSGDSSANFKKMLEEEKAKLLEANQQIGK
jgi:hypothetical protein